MLPPHAFTSFSTSDLPLSGRVQTMKVFGEYYYNLSFEMYQILWADSWGHTESQPLIFGFWIAKVVR